MTLVSLGITAEQFLCPLRYLMDGPVAGKSQQSKRYCYWWGVGVWGVGKGVPTNKK